MVQRDLFAKPQAHHAPEINKGQEKKSQSCWNYVIKAFLGWFETKHTIANLVIPKHESPTPKPWNVIYMH